MLKTIHGLVPFECAKCTANCNCMKCDNGDWYYDGEGEGSCQGGGGGCFAGSSTVETQRGNIQIGNLLLGDSILTSSIGKGIKFTEVRRKM